MTYTVTTDYKIDKVAAPNLPNAPTLWNSQFQDQYSNVLRLYFNRLDKFISQLMTTSSSGFSTTPPQWVRNTAAVSVPTTNVFVPMASIRLNASHTTAQVIPYQYSILPISSANYEVAVVRNVSLTGASWVTGTFQDVDYDISATAFTTQPTASQFCQVGYVSTAYSEGIANTLAALSEQTGFQLGASDVLTLAIRTIGASGSANSAYGSLGFYDLTL